MSKVCETIDDRMAAFLRAQLNAESIDGLAGFASPTDPADPSR